MATVFFPLWRGFSIRLLLKTDVIKVLVKNKINIVLLLPETIDKNFWRSFQHSNISIEKLEFSKLDKNFRSKRYFRFRNIRYLTYGQNFNERLGTNKYHRIDAWNIKIHGFKFNVILKYFYNKINFGFNIIFAWILSHFSIIRRLFIYVEKIIFKADFHKSLYLKHKPSLIIVPSLGYGLDAFLMNEAKRNDVKILAVIQSWDNLTSKGYGGCIPDYAVTWNEINKKELIHHHDVSPEKIYVGGVPHWDGYFQKMNSLSKKDFIKKHGLDPQKKIIFFPAATPKLYRYSIEVADDILNHIKSGAYGSPCQLLFRIHPAMYIMDGDNKWQDKFNQFNNRIDDLKKRYGELIIINMPDLKSEKTIFDISKEDQVTLSEILKFSNVLVNVYSTLMLEASIFDLPIINIAYNNYRDTKYQMSVYDEFDHIKPVNATGAVKNAYNEDEFHYYIKRYLNDKSLESKERRILMETMIPVNRGDAGKKLGTHIVNILNNIE